MTCLEPPSREVAEPGFEPIGLAPPFPPPHSICSSSAYCVGARYTGETTQISVPALGALTSSARETRNMRTDRWYLKCYLEMKDNKSGGLEAQGGGGG